MLLVVSHVNSDWLQGLISVHEVGELERPMPAAAVQHPGLTRSCMLIVAQKAPESAAATAARNAAVSSVLPSPVVAKPHLESTHSTVLDCASYLA